MSRAEKFIEEHTSNCSNEILSPYPQINNDVRRLGGEPAKEFSPWLTPDQARKAVEIAKEEMIEKFCEWVKKNVTYTHPRKGTEECIINLSKFKEAMRNE